MSGNPDWVELRSCRPHPVRGFSRPFWIIAFALVMLLVMTYADADRTYFIPRWEYWTPRSVWILMAAAAGTWAGYNLLVRLNPRPVIYARPGVARPGDRVEIKWRFTGSVSRIRRFSVHLVEVSETISDSEDQSTDRSDQVRDKPVENAEHRRLAEGLAAVTIPGHGAPSTHEAVSFHEWQIRFTADIPFWPDVDCSFEIPVEAR